MTDEKTETKTGADSGAKKAPVARAAPRAEHGFGDAPLSSPVLEPVSFSKRQRPTLYHALEIFGLVLSPAQLAIAITLLPLIQATKPGLLAMLGGMVTAAVMTVVAQVPLLRFGLSAGVLARATFGVRGAKVFSLLRALSLVFFFATGVYLAVQTLSWAVLCAAPGAVALIQILPMLGGVSLATVCVTILGVILLWLFSSAPSLRARVALALPPLLLVVLLTVLPDNLPLGTAWGMLDVVGRADSEAVLPVFLASTLWAAAIFTSPLSEVRLQPTQLGQTLAVIGPGIVPWLGGALAMALAVLSSGQSDSGFFDLPALACRRLGTPLLLTVLAAAAVSFVWPLAHVAKRGAVMALHETLGGEASGRTLRIAEYGLLTVGAVLALATRTELASAGLPWFLILSSLVTLMIMLSTCSYFLVERTRLVLDDLYALRGAYRGVAGFLPAGWLSIAAAVVVVVVMRQMGYAVAVSAGLALAASLLAQALFGNLQKLSWQRRKK